MAYQSPTQALCAFPTLQPAPQNCGSAAAIFFSRKGAKTQRNLTAPCHFFLVSWFLHLGSCFLLLASNLLLLLNTECPTPTEECRMWGKIACLVRPSVNHQTVSVYPKMFPVPREFALSA